jgi:hypothetical protein
MVHVWPRAARATRHVAVDAVGVGESEVEAHGSSRKVTWFENDGRVERPGLEGLAVPSLNSNCLPLIKSP